METSDIYVKLTAIFQEIFEDKYLAINPHLTSGDVEDWDSLSHIRLILSVEAEFDIKFATGELSQFENVGQLVEMISEKVSA